MKTNLIKSFVYGSVVTVVSFGLNAFAADVTGDRLNIGSGHTLSGTGSTIAGGWTNTVANDYSAIGGGILNTNTAPGAFIGGGELNLINGDRSVIGGGSGNYAGSVFTTIGGGSGNYVGNAAEACSVGGGEVNSIPGGRANVISGGEFNVNNGDADSTIAGGAGNSIGAAITATIGGGAANVASGYYSTIPGGLSANASNFGQFAYANGSFSEAGDAQMSMYVVRNVTENTNSTELFLQDGQRMLIHTNSSWTFDILVTSRNANGDSAHYQIVGGIKNVNGTTSLVGTPAKTVLGEDNSSWDATVIADDTNDALSVVVTGDNTAIRWVATVRTVEVKN